MKTLTFKVTGDERRHIQHLAALEKLTVSGFLRRRACGDSVSSAAPAKVRCEFTGAEIFAPLPHQPALTTASVRAMLEEFPRGICLM